MYRAPIMNRPLRAQQQECSDACVIEYDEQALPSFVEMAPDAPSVGAKDASAYVARKGDEALATFLFRRHRGKVQVINEGLQLPVMEVARFVDFVFMRFPEASVVSFIAIDVNLQALRLPYQQTNNSQSQVHIFRSRRALARNAGLIFATALRGKLSTHIKL